MSRLNKKFFSRLGIRKVDVPNLSGLTRDQSIAVLNAVGLVPVDTPTNTENINLNLGIVSQSQAAGSTVLIGSQVTFNYYNYVAPPNFNPGFNPGFSNPGFNPGFSNPGFAPVSDCIDDDAGYCANVGADGYGDFYQYQYSPSGQFSCGARYIGRSFCGVPNPGFNPGFTPDFNPGFTPDFNPGFTPDFSSPSFYDITLTSLDLSALFSFGGKSVGITTLVRTTDGLVKAGDLRVGDTLLSANIEGFPYEGDEGITAQAIAWSDNNPNIIPEVTTIANLYKTQSAFAVVINEDIFSQYHYILIQRNGVSKFETSVNIIKETDLVYSYDTSSWEPIYLYEIVQAPHDIISINCEPYDMFFTERMLTHDSSAI
jgi:hypothetical protein